MITFAVVVGDVFVNKIPQVCFAKDDELIEALMPEVLRIRVQPIDGRNRGAS